MHSDAKSLRERGDRLFTDKRVLDSRNQDIAEQFYPERADFTSTHSLGDDFASHLTTGYPSMVRRDLGNALGAMLRPRAKQWFHVRTTRWDAVDHEGRRWCEWATQVMRRAINDRMTNFMRATKEADHDFACFGQAVLSVDMNRRDNALLYRSWHLRDVAWCEDAYGQIGQMHLNWSPSAQQLASLFPGKVHPNVTRLIETKKGDTKVKVRRVMIRADEYGMKKVRQPWVSAYLDCENDHVIEETGSATAVFVPPRWATLSGSQYAFSPASVVALPDARLLQAQALTLLEAGEKAVNPPLVGIGDAMPGGVQIYAGGFTSVDAEYDQKLSEILRPINQDIRSLPFGVDMADRTAAQIREAFFLNTLSMPPAGNGEMTAFEVGQRVQEYIRQALPLFEPMEHEYNGALCEVTFDTLMLEGAFGPPDSIPQSIRGSEVQFVFDSPLAEMIEREKGQKYMEAQAMVASSVEIAPDSLLTVDFGTALRDSLEGIGVPTKWLRSEEDVVAIKSKQAEDAAAAQQLAGLQQGADVAATLGGAAKSFADARVA